MTATQTYEIPHPGADLDVLARVRLAREMLASIPKDVAGVFSHDVAEVAAEVAAAVAAANAAQAAVVLEASARGIIAASDHPRPQRWVEQSCREGGAPVTRRAARDLHEVTLTCAGPDGEPFRDAVTCGRLPVESAGLAATVFRRLRRDIDYPNWEALAEIIIDWAAAGASPRQLRQLEEQVLGQYGTGALAQTHDRQHHLREMSTFRLGRGGMLTATVRLDPASEAVLTAALDALSAPRPTTDDQGRVVQADDRTPGQRRADALITLAGLATSADPHVPGSGAKARVVLTMTLADLLTATGSATTDLGATLTAAEARTLACDAEVLPAVLGSPGQLLDLGRRTRLVTTTQRLALGLRDSGCTYPGCQAPPGWCDGHHIHHWANGGTTDLTNLTLLCRHHHTLVHRHGHTATLDHHGVHWRRADGTPIGNTPRAGWHVTPRRQ